MRDQFTGDGIVLDNALMFWIHRVQQAVRTRTYALFREAGVELTPEQWMVLVRLWEREGLTPSELSDATFKDRPTMTRILDVMEGRGWLTRRVAAGDARSRRVFLTAAGRALRGRLVPLVRRFVPTMLSGIPDDDLEITRRTLRRMLENVEAQLPGGEP